MAESRERGSQLSLFPASCLIRGIVASGEDSVVIGDPETPYPELPCPWGIFQPMGK